jgi:rhodanese-related sulfurtransferase
LITEIEPAELVAWRQDAGRDPPIVVDVREPWEFDHCRIADSCSLPLGSLPQALDDLPRNRAYVVVCHHGVRSFHAAAWLKRAGFDRVHNLRGGIAAWADQVEPAMNRY